MKIRHKEDAFETIELFKKIKVNFFVETFV
jgi:hypothetical protein